MHKLSRREKALITYKRKLKLKRIFFSGILIITIGLAGYLMFKAYYRPPLPVAKNVIDISADMGGFSLTEIHVHAGEPVSIRLRSLDNSYHSDGGGKHQWAVDEFNVNIIAPPLGVEMATFTPTIPGTYIFYCDICCGGRINPSMNGILIVEG